MEVKTKRKTENESERQPEIFGAADPTPPLLQDKKQKDHGASVKEGDGMLVLGVDADALTKIRNKQEDRIDQLREMGVTAMLRFESILRHRKAEEAIKKGFGETAKGTVKGWMVGNLKKVLPIIFDVADIAEAAFKVGMVEVSVAETGYETLKDGIEGQVQAKQAAVEVDVIDALINSTRHAIRSSAKAASDRVRNATELEVLELDKSTRYEIPSASEADVDALIGKLDAQFSRSMFDQGAWTSSEYLSHLKEREKLQSEVDKARIAHPVEK